MDSEAEATPETAPQVTKALVEKEKDMHVAAGMTQARSDQLVPRECRVAYQHLESRKDG